MDLNTLAYPLHRTAVVVDNKDEDEKGRVKVRVVPELEEISEDLLPWASPQTQSQTGISEGVGQHTVPDEGSIVVVVIYDKHWETIDYTLNGSMHLPDLYPYEKAREDLEDVEDGDKDDMEYPQPSFRRTKDGVVQVHDTENGQVGLYHPSGLYLWINSEGKLTIRKFKSVTLMKDDEHFFKINEDGEVEIKTSKVHVEADEYQINDGDDSVVLFEPLEEIIEAILEANVIAPSGPSTPLQQPNGTPLTALAPNLRNMKSETVTSD